MCMLLIDVIGVCVLVYQIFTVQKHLSHDITTFPCGYNFDINYKNLTLIYTSIWHWFCVLLIASMLSTKTMSNSFGDNLHDRSNKTCKCNDRIYKEIRFDAMNIFPRWFTCVNGCIYEMTCTKIHKQPVFSLIASYTS